MKISVERKIGMIKASAHDISVTYCPVTKAHDVVIDGVTYSCFTDSELDKYIIAKYKERVERETHEPS